MRTVALVLGLIVAASGCAGMPLKLNNPIMPNETKVAEVDAHATGIMIFNILPVGQNERFVEAYRKALAKAPGATRIADVEISEDWFWAYLLNGYITTIRGIAVRGQ